MLDDLKTWQKLAYGLLILQVFLYAIPKLRPSKAGMVCWYFGCDRILWPLIALALLIWAIWSGFRDPPFWSLSRGLGGLALILLAFSPRLFHIYPSSYDRKPSDVDFRLPMEGPVKVAWGGETPDVNYHVFVPDQRWAYDFFILKDGSTHRGEGDTLEDYYCYGAPIYAPADGTVHSITNDSPDMPPGKLGGNPAGGNQIILQVAPNEFLHLCHLKAGSLQVSPGDTVRQGDLLAHLGNSGNTSEPHLHMHLQDSEEEHWGEGIPILFSNYRNEEGLVARGMPIGGVHFGEWCGETVENAKPLTPT